MRKETREWLNKAHEDMETSLYCLNGGHIEAAAFHAQQAAEKALKALQIERLKRFDRTHDLLLLARSIQAPREVLAKCKKLTPFYTMTRYPNAKKPFGAAEVTIAVEAGQEVLKWADQSLK